MKISFCLYFTLTTRIRGWITLIAVALTATVAVADGCGGTVEQFSKSSAAFVGIVGIVGVDQPPLLPVTMPISALDLVFGILPN